MPGRLRCAGFFTCYVMAATIIIMLGTGWVGYDFGQRTIAAIEAPKKAA